MQKINLDINEIKSAKTMNEIHSIIDELEKSIKKGIQPDTFFQEILTLLSINLDELSETELENGGGREFRKYLLSRIEALSKSHAWDMKSKKPRQDSKDVLSQNTSDIENIYEELFNLRNDFMSVKNQLSEMEKDVVEAIENILKELEIGIKGQNDKIKKHMKDIDSGMKMYREQIDKNIKNISQIDKYSQQTATLSTKYFKDLIKKINANEKSNREKELHIKKFEKQNEDFSKKLMKIIKNQEKFKKEINTLHILTDSE